MGYPGTWGYLAAKAMIEAAYVVLNQTEDQAPSNYGTDFRVSTGTDLWQIQQNMVIAMLAAGESTQPVVHGERLLKLQPRPSSHPPPGSPSAPRRSRSLSAVMLRMSRRSVT